MKKVFFAVLAILSIFSFCFSAVDAADVKAKKGFAKAYDTIYEITLPANVGGYNTVTKIEESSWFCDNDETIQVKQSWTNFLYAVKVSQLTKHNIGKVSLVGKNWEGADDNITGYLSFDLLASTVLITFAGQYCRQEYEQYYDETAGKYTCQVWPGMVCDQVEYDLQGDVVLTVGGYTSIR